MIKLWTTFSSLILPPHPKCSCLITRNCKAQTLFKKESLGKHKKMETKTRTLEETEGSETYTANSKYGIIPSQRNIKPHAKGLLPSVHIT